MMHCYIEELMRADLADLRWTGFGPLKSLAVTNGYQLMVGSYSCCVQLPLSLKAPGFIP